MTALEQAPPRTPTVTRPPGFWRSLLLFWQPRLPARKPRTAATVPVPPSDAMTAPRQTASVPSLPGARAARRRPSRETERSETLAPVVPSPAKPASRPGTTPAARTRSPWLLREALTLIATAGAALTLLSHLAWQMRMTPEMLDVVGSWYFTVGNAWQNLAGILGERPHSHMQAALTLSFFLALMGIGARISQAASGKPAEPSRGIPFPSLVLFVIVTATFAFIYRPAPGDVLMEAYGRDNVPLQFALALGAGYMFGHLVGRRGFHIRLYWLTFAVAGALVWNAAQLASP